jgi:SAM-dependent methyltransferase
MRGKRLVVAHFLANLTSAAMHARLAQWCAEDPAHRVLHYLLGPDRVLEWTHSIGVATDRRLAACVPPLPPLALREITAEIELPMFLYTGFLDLMQLVALYEQYADGLPPRPRVLDFGCGCGRLTRFLDSTRWEACASEVNADHVAWCRANLPDVDTRLNGHEPPLDFDAGSFDFSFSVSIFSHLSATMVDAWLHELGRLTKPSGIVIATFHGEQALRVIAGSADHQASTHMTPEEARAILERLPHERIVLLAYPEEQLPSINVGTSAYGVTFIDPRFIGEIALRHHLEPVAYVTAGLRGFQDIVVLRRLG